MLLFASVSFSEKPRSIVFPSKELISFFEVCPSCPKMLCIAQTNIVGDVQRRNVFTGKDNVES